jgi:DNA anti-recombination protein RmuC
MALVYGLKGFKIEQQAKVIMGELSNIQSSFGKFYTDFTLIGKHLGNATSKFNDSLKNAEKFNDKILQITGIKHDLIDSSETILIEEE